MRLIDADALKKDIARLHALNDEKEIRKAYASNPHSTMTDFEDTLVSVFDAIDDAPTIEPSEQVTGKLESIEIPTVSDEESTMGQPKSKLDLISRADAIDKLAEAEYHNVEDYRTAVKVIGALPSADRPQGGGTDD